MNKVYGNNFERDYSIYVYGKIFDLIEDLNSYNLKCYINNEKNIDLWKEFKYKKKSKWRFISTLDYYGNFKNIKCEFDVIPIIFNNEYEILYLGVSVFFKDNFWEEYKNGNYNYIELFISHINVGYIHNFSNSQYENGCNVIHWDNRKRNILKCLINLDYLRRLYKEEKLKNYTDRITNTTNDNNHKDIINSYNYYIENINTEKYHNKYNKNTNDNIYKPGCGNNYNVLYNKNNNGIIFNNASKKIYAHNEDVIINRFTDSANPIHSHENDVSICKNDTSYESSDSFIIKTNNECNYIGDTRYRISYSGECNYIEKCANVNGLATSHIDNSQGKQNNSQNEHINQYKCPCNHMHYQRFYDNSSINCQNSSRNLGIPRDSTSAFQGIHRKIKSAEDSLSVFIGKTEQITYNNAKMLAFKENASYLYDKELINYEYSYINNERNKIIPIDKTGNNYDGSLIIEGEKPYTSLPNNNSSSWSSSYDSGGNNKVQMSFLEKNEVLLKAHQYLIKTSEKSSNVKSDNLTDCSGNEPVHYNKNDHIQCGITTTLTDTNVRINQKSEFKRNVYICNENISEKSNNSPFDNYINENKQNKENEKWKNFKSGFFSSKGNRTYNEDRVVTISSIYDFIHNECKNLFDNSKQHDADTNANEEIYCDDYLNSEYFDHLFKSKNIENNNMLNNQYMYCAIYDGHNGENAVNIIQKLLHIHVYSYYINGISICNALKYGFQRMDEHLCKKSANSKENNHSDFSSGSTACVSVILNNMVYIANIGDSRCVLSKNGRAVVITVDHKASINKKEEQRIINSGGILDQEGYLGGCLGVCRGFGSFDKKTNEKLKGLICEPDIFQIKLTDDDEFLIICCDGIFDVMTSQEAVNTVRTSLVENNDPNVAAEALCQLAYKRKSLDNLSVVIIIFQNPEHKKKENISANVYTGQTGRFRRRIKFSALENLISP
ncbi:protein phosphatase PPM1 [Plasmodium berghei]|uniref:Protein phosphatase PPM1 n=2 Tax=Plasmodium berghei TaxID=5821 RepID=A0A509AQT2_PLABA|nr:protein phosphatase PPM1 [Plasmodium berghei ANKA]SCL94147.1 protein phosphatase PPM1 [Plasmodium berghei]SCM15952.1 protein phosphatase PPM1 [Plasmodium berghei]SCN25946.1 protein phosphatase PPM1 [Plasmodium berghei]VUC56075.1 protein phosphatase PPM1 [Plasmodium berghei ANKA]|eukprot:XP_034421877.1 protein phosphatase PPM1 [Plasmodium berghei ANKA]